MISQVLQKFKQMLSIIDWNSVTKLHDAIAAYSLLLEIFSGISDVGFLEQKIKIKNKTHNSPWITKSP